MVGSVVGHTSQTIQQYTADGTKDRPTAEVDRKESKSIFGKSVSYDIRTGANLTRARTSWAGFKRLMTNVFDKPWAATLGKLSTTAMARKEAREVRQAGYQLDKTVNDFVSKAASGKTEHSFETGMKLDGLKQHVDTLKKAGFSDQQIQARISQNLSESLDKLRQVDPEGYKTAVEQLEVTFCLKMTHAYRTAPFSEDEAKILNNLRRMGMEGPDPAKDCTRMLLPAFRTAILQNHIDSGTMSTGRMLGIVDATFGKGQLEKMSGDLSMLQSMSGEIEPQSAERMIERFDTAATLYQTKGYTAGDIAGHSIVRQDNPQVHAAFDKFAKSEMNFENVAWLRDLYQTQTNKDNFSTDELRAKADRLMAGIDSSASGVVDRKSLSGTDSEVGYTPGSINAGSRGSKNLIKQMKDVMKHDGNYSLSDLRNDIDTMNRDQLLSLIDALGDPTDPQAKVSGIGREAPSRQVYKNVGDTASRFDAAR